VPLKIDSEKKTIALSVKDLAALVAGPAAVNEVAYGVARMTLGRQSAAALHRMVKEKIREHEACVAQARRDWRHAVRLLAQIPEAV
jgi:hypothetical protein